MPNSKVNEILQRYIDQTLINFRTEEIHMHWNIFQTVYERVKVILTYLHKVIYIYVIVQDEGDNMISRIFTSRRNSS